MDFNAIIKAWQPEQKKKYFHLKASTARTPWLRNIFRQKIKSNSINRTEQFSNKIRNSTSTLKRLPIVRNPDDWRNFTGSWKIIQNHLVLHVYVWFIVYNCRYFISHRSERLHPGRLLCVDGGELFILFYICCTSFYLYYGEFVFEKALAIAYDGTIKTNFRHYRER